MSKIGSEFRVNTQTLYDQTLAQSAKLKSGGFVSVWVDWADVNNTTVADGSWSGIKAQIFSPDGSKLGDERLVNTATLNWQQDPHVAVLQNGNFAVTWTDGWDYFSWADHPGSLGVGGAQGDNAGKAIKLQVFTADGTLVGPEVLVNTAIYMDQTASKLTALDNGNFVVTWEDWHSSCAYDASGNPVQCGGGPSVQARLYDPNGNAIGNEFVVAGTYSYAPQITTLADGGFVVTWHDGHYSVDDVMAQVYAADGMHIGQQIRVNTAGSGATYSMQSEERVVGLSQGGFAVTWTDGNGDDSGRGIKTQVFDAQGARVGSEMLVNTTTHADQWHPQITALKGGNFVIAWDDWSDGIDVRAQIFSASGSRVGSEILANTTKGGAQDGVQIAALDDGGFAVSWCENWRDIKYQVFDATGTKTGPETLANTTTEGGQSGAQLTTLNDGTLLIAWNNDLYGPSDGSGASIKAQIFAYDQTWVGGVGNDNLSGGLGIDTAVFTGNLSSYTLSKAGSTYTVRANTGSDGTDTLTSIESLHFADKTVNLTIQAKAAAAPQADVQRLAELYVAFFNRVPDADGLSYWIDQLGAGQNVPQIAEAFYNAGIQYSSLTGFSAGMTGADFVNVIYKNVLGRSEGADAGGLVYWTDKLANGTESHGSLVTTILTSAHSFKGDTTWGWVADLLDNKLTVAKTFAVDWGLNYNTAAESISQGMAIAAAVTPTDTSAAITLIGVTGSELQLG